MNHRRQMRGEDLQGLTIEELVHLERTIDVGLTRVLLMKVYMPVHTYCIIIQVVDHLITPNNNLLFQTAFRNDK